jgi:hypothetical protein
MQSCYTGKGIAASEYRVSRELSLDIGLYHHQSLTSCRHAELLPSCWIIVERISRLGRDYLCFFAKSRRRRSDLIHCQYGCGEGRPYADAEVTRTLRNHATARNFVQQKNCDHAQLLGRRHVPLCWHFQQPMGLNVSAGEDASHKHEPFSNSRATGVLNTGKSHKFRVLLLRVVVMWSLGRSSSRNFLLKKIFSSPASLQHTVASSFLFLTFLAAWVFSYEPPHERST